jgi:hypothetical protein
LARKENCVAGLLPKKVKGNVSTGTWARQTARVKVPLGFPAAVAATTVPEDNLAAIAELSPAGNKQGNRAGIFYTTITTTHSSSSPTPLFKSRFFKKKPRTLLLSVHRSSEVISPKQPPPGNIFRHPWVGPPRDLC